MSDKTLVVHTIIENIDALPGLVEAFLLDRKAAGLSPKTVRFYRQSLGAFLAWAQKQNITQIGELSPAALRSFLVYLQDTGHNDGGRHVFYRSLRAWLNWYADEIDSPDFRNPIDKVTAPKLSTEPLDPATVDDLRALLAVCKTDRIGKRDRAILYILADTGIRAAELIALDLADTNPMSGDIQIRQGKGKKSRSAFLGKKARRALRSYLKSRQDNHPALFVTDDGERLTYSGLRQIIRRRAAHAGINPPQLHSFRRLFALSMLRANVDVYALSKLMGHSSIQTLQRYLKLLDNDAREAHAKGSPADRLL